jgi:Holliday junction resolvase
MKSESTVQKQILEYLTSKGGYVIRNANATKSGIADLTVCYKGKYIAIETKKEKGGVVSEKQKRQAAKLDKAGGITIFANSLNCVIEFLEKRNK